MNKQICFSCKYTRPCYFYDLNKRPICNICANEVYRYCKTCGKKIPAGFGNFCNRCTSMNGIYRKLRLDKFKLQNTMKLFVKFCLWLARYRDPHYSSINIQRFHKHFMIIDHTIMKLQKFPSFKDIYFEYINISLSCSSTVLKFLKIKKLINISNQDKKEYHLQKTIHTYLKKHKHSQLTFSSAFLKYHEYLNNKPKIALSAIRQALTSANSLIEILIFYNLKDFNKEAISSFIFIYPGHKSSITGFINFLHKKNFIDYSMKTLPETELTRPSLSEKYLEFQILKILRFKKHSDKQKQRFLHLSLSYFHRLQLPKYSYISNRILIHTNGKYYIKLYNTIFYIPLVLRST